MAATTNQSRITQLLSKADEFINAKDLPRAAEALREASRLDGKNAEVKEKWTEFHKLEDGVYDVLELLRIYIGSQQTADGEKVLTALRRKSLVEKDAVEATELVLHAKNSPGLLDTIAATLLTRNVEARKAVATKLSSNATEIFDLMFELGEATFDALASIPLEAFIWPSKEKQATAQRDLFRLCIATLIEPGAENLERVMRCLARLLALASDTVAPIVDADDIDAILSSLDIRLADSLRSQAMLATSKLLENMKEGGEELFSNFITRRAEKQTNDDLIIVFSAAAAVFPMIPTATAKLFLTDGFIQQLVPNLERNSEDGHAGNRKSHNLEMAALELLSAACVDNACREAIKRYCSHWLENLTEEPEGTHKALAALVLAKISADSPENITAKLEQLVLTGDHESEQAIEGLAYTSLQAAIKEEIAGNKKLMTQLLTTLQQRPAVTFGCLTIFTNITAYRATMSEEQKKMSQLKAYANSSKPVVENPLDDPAHVTERCRKVLDMNLVPVLVALYKQSMSLTNVALISKIMLSLAREQKHRTTMAQEGAVKLLLQIRDWISRLNKSTPEAPSIERDAAHALARLLISLNPEHIFSAALPASNAVSALVPLLYQDQDIEQRDLLPVFEALLALTNLASMEDDTIRDLQVRLVWPPLEDRLLLSSNVLVQRASVELVCNLVASPSCVAKFVADGSKREATRMQILLALADVEDVATRRAAGGALAMLTQWDAAVAAVLDQNKDSGPKGVKIILSMCADASEEMKHRGFVCVSNIVNAPGEIGKRGTKSVLDSDGVEILQEALKKTKNRDIVEIGVELLRKLMG